MNEQRQRLVSFGFHELTCAQRTSEPSSGPEPSIGREQVRFDFSRSEYNWDSIPLLNRETTTNTPALDKLNCRFAEYLHETGIEENREVKFDVLRQFCVLIREELLEEIDEVDAKKRRMHDAIMSSRKLVILDDRKDEKYTQHIASIPTTLSKQQVALVTAGDLASSQLAMLDNMSGGEPILY
jgi:hypothetical protein